MLLIKNNVINAQPMIDLVESSPEHNRLRESVEQYIIRHKLPVIRQAERTEAFYQSAMSNYHHPRLLTYLNNALNDIKFVRVIGFFADHHNPHIWLKSGNLIVDATVSQFADKIIKIHRELQFLVSCSYFISDNPQNYIYRLYREL
jgi:hypothetical protein